MENPLLRGDRWRQNGAAGFAKAGVCSKAPAANPAIPPYQRPSTHP
ncbi:hypothetical protein L6773_14340 [Rhodohalobacter sp. WB101]|uniref:Uncharacterized protein n=1 Tax=Rhodohalobacter sulfatireducens TaxID=2911366 RepID=A0ABS9KFY4_9BACT|nr:hypothetical protein [Rhodohalobacter sulfatireducens]